MLRITLPAFVLAAILAGCAQVPPQPGSNRPQLSYAEAQARYQQGLSEQTRTNVLIGVTGGLGLLTFISIFLMLWSQPKEGAAVAIVPTVGFGSVGLAGRF